MAAAQELVIGAAQERWVAQVQKLGAAAGWLGQQVAAAQALITAAAQKQQEMPTGNQKQVSVGPPTENHEQVSTGPVTANQIGQMETMWRWAAEALGCWATEANNVDVGHGEESDRELASPGAEDSRRLAGHWLANSGAGAGRELAGQWLADSGLELAES